MAKRRTDRLEQLNAALALHRAGRIDEAESAYQRVLAEFPKDADALNLLGVIAQDRGRPALAVQLISQALNSRQDFPQALTNLARAQRAAGDPAGAAVSARRAIALAPDIPEAFVQLGRALLDLEDDVLAAEACRRAVSLGPQSLDAHVNLAAALTRLNDFTGAAQAYQAAHMLKPDRPETLTDFGTVLTRLERFDDALRCHERAIAVAPNDVRVHAGHAATLRQAQNVTASAEACRRALGLAPDRPDLWLFLGHDLAALGRFEEAVGCYRKVLELDPANAEAPRGIVAVGDTIDDAAELTRLRAATDDAKLPVSQRIAAGFALGALLDKTGKYDAAFERFKTANELAKGGREEEAKGFDRDALQQEVDDLIATFTPALFARTSGRGERSELPIFIVGMPRSGTTLTEQILASHPMVFGAGERRDVGRIEKLLRIECRTDEPGDWDPALVRREAEAHVRRLHAMDSAALRVIDKMPDNVFFLGTIALLFPDARIVICRRDLRDVCLSCYFQSFSSNLNWTHDLADCAFRAREVERLLEHWREVLPLPMLDVQYESLVADLEGQGRRLVDFLGLPWDLACLAFHETERQIMTASLWQVRQPIYTSSVGRWRAYRRHLQPLLDGLEGLIEDHDAARPMSADARAAAG